MKNRGGKATNAGPVKIYVSIATRLALFAAKGTVPFLLAQKSGQSPTALARRYTVGFTIVLD
jgi:hypothetical protein